MGPDTRISQHVAVREAVIAAYGRPDALALPQGDAPVGHYGYMARLSAMRRAMADGTAAPDEVADFEAEVARRQDETERRLRHFADQVLERRSEDIFFNATFPLLLRLCEILKELGAAEVDLSGGNALMTGGGLKGMNLPPDYQERIFRLLDMEPNRFLHNYSITPCRS